MISRHFAWAEFEASATAKAHGLDNRMKSEDVVDAVAELVTYILEPLRERCGYPLHINSGYRCRALNSLVGGQPTSQHLTGEAADVRPGRGTPLQLAAVARKTPEIWKQIDQMIIYPTFVHISHKRGAGVKSQRHQLLYSKDYKGLKSL